MFEKLQKYWNEYGLELLAGISVVVIVILFFINLITNRQGSYTNAKRVPTTSNSFPSTDPNFKFKEHTPQDSKLEIRAKIVLENIFLTIIVYFDWQRIFCKTTKLRIQKF